MSEIIEINEDNCVLDEEELNEAREMFIFCCKSEVKYWKNVDVIFEKITKLNDMVKQKENDDD